MPLHPGTQAAAATAADAAAAAGVVDVAASGYLVHLSDGGPPVAPGELAHILPKVLHSLVALNTSYNAVFDVFS